MSHVDVYRERQPSGLASPLYRASDTHPPEGLAALVDEDVGRLGPVRLLLPLQEFETVHLIPLQVVDAVGALPFSELSLAEEVGPRIGQHVPIRFPSRGSRSTVGHEVTCLLTTFHIIMWKVVHDTGEKSQ
jgi:hypothetical protein